MTERDLDGDMADLLDSSEAARLTRLETVIENGIAMFVKVGDALLEIRSKKLYRESHDTFEDYCAERWNLKRPRAYELMEAASVVELVSEISDKVPARESHAAELAPLLNDPPALREAWAEVVDQHPEPTVKDVRNVVAGRLYRLTPVTDAMRYSNSSESKRKRQIAEKRKERLWAVLRRVSYEVSDYFDEDSIQVAAAVTSYDELNDMVKIAKENARLYRALGQRIEKVMQARRDAGLPDLEDHEAWQLAALAQQRAQLVMPEGVRVRYVQLRRPGRSPTFEATMTPKRAKR
jgi:hypothetical protein